ncbi:ferrous iron transport protein A [Natronomonas sp. F2-12]|uniref:Ferrous iron transport protein A n=1 Tax=Natronomonas aquatica TaxID=2841590 RepID=A0A9R1CS70_9EURY|nr:ferrous iron transport protein A [Natronomonas aquatica]
MDDSVRNERVLDKDLVLLRYLSAHGIHRRTVVEIIEITSFGMVTLDPGNEDEPVALPAEVARSISTKSVTRDTN